MVGVLGKHMYTKAFTWSQSITVFIYITVPNLAGHLKVTSKTLRRALLGESGMEEEARLLSTISSTGQLPSFPKAEFLAEQKF